MDGIKSFFVTGLNKVFHKNIIGGDIGDKIDFFPFSAGKDGNRYSERMIYADIWRKRVSSVRRYRYNNSCLLPESMKAQVKKKWFSD